MKQLVASAILTMTISTAFAKNSAEVLGTTGYVADGTQISFNGETLLRFYRLYGRDGARSRIDARMQNSGTAQGLAIYTHQNQNPNGPTGCNEITAKDIPMGRREDFLAKFSTVVALPYLGNQSDRVSDIWTPTCLADKSVWGETFGIINASAVPEESGMGFYIAAGRNSLLGRPLYAQSLSPELNKSTDNSDTNIRIQPANKLAPFVGATKTLELSFVNKIGSLSANHRHLKVLTTLNLSSKGSNCGDAFFRCKLNLAFLHLHQDSEGRLLTSPKVFFDPVQGGKPVITSPISANGNFEIWDARERYENSRYTASQGEPTQYQKHSAKRFALTLEWKNFQVALKIAVMERLAQSGALPESTTLSTSGITNQQMKAHFGDAYDKPESWDIDGVSMRSEFDNPYEETTALFIGTHWRNLLLRAK